MAELESLLLEIENTAKSHNMLVFRGNLAFENACAFEWGGSWEEFLDMAKEANAMLLYVYAHKFDIKHIYEDLENADAIFSADNPDDDERQWIRSRVNEFNKPWESKNKRLASINCYWVNNGVVHRWHIHTDWITELYEALDTFIAETKGIDSQNRVLRNEEAAQILHVYADKLAHHPRFTEAASEEKREFMASQLYPELNDDSVFGYRAHATIARRAALVYWWDIEPAINASKSEKARALRAEGESIRSIAAILKMPESKVRAAINEA